MSSARVGSIKQLIPPEFLELNWRLWSFVLISVLGTAILLLYRVPIHDGLTDPFYTPTVLILPIVVGFRLTCYAYRKDYHRHLFYHPNSCAVNVRFDRNTRGYSGETGLFRIENIHRYFMYTAWAVLPFFFYDIYVSMTYSGSFTFTVGTIVLTVNAVMVTLYTFSCHSVRHLIGGYKNCFGCAANLGKKTSLFKVQSKFNEYHEPLAWTSLIMFIFVDIFLRGMVAGVIPNMVLIHLGL